MSLESIINKPPSRSSIDLAFQKYSQTIAHLIWNWIIYYDIKMYNRNYNMTYYSWGLLRRTLPALIEKNYCSQQWIIVLSQLKVIATSPKPSIPVPHPVYCIPFYVYLQPSNVPSTKNYVKSFEQTTVHIF